MPDIRNCKRCGKLYNFIGGLPICPECKKKDDEDFKRVKEYLYDNPGASINQVSMELEVSIQRIKQYLKEGRLEIVGEGGNLILECEICGRSIRTGRFCNECSNSLKNDIASASEQIIKKSETQQADKKHGMRYLIKDDE